MALKAGSVTDQNPGHDCPRGAEGLSEGVRLGFGINANGEVVGGS